MDKSDIQNKVDFILKITRLSDWRNRMPYQLSGGQQQRVAIGRALVMSPPILLADEPTGNLDFNTTNEILAALVEMKEQLDQSIVLVTHDVNVASYADRILFFHNGKIVDEYQSDRRNNLDEIIKKFRGMVEAYENVFG
jgi:putative ABC transport system ATP-binding protein